MAENDTDELPRKTVGELIEELKALDPSRPIVFGVVVDSEEEEEDGAGEVEVYDMDSIKEMEGEDGPGYVILCDLREEDMDDEEDEAAA